MSWEQGYLWGSDVAPLIGCLGDGRRFEVIILSDLLFNHREHPAMLKSCKDSLAPGGSVYVIFSSHRPWLAEKDKVFWFLFLFLVFGFVFGFGFV